MMAILSSIVNMIGGDLYDHLVSTTIFTLIMNNILISKNYDAKTTWHDLDC